MGEDREDVASELHVWSNGYDEAEAQRLAKGHAAQAEPRQAGRLTFTLDYPKERRQRANSRCASRPRCGSASPGTPASSDDQRTGDVEARRDARRRDHSRRVAGRVSVVAPRRRSDDRDVGALKLTASGTDVRLARVRGDATAQAQAGEITASELEGAVDIEGNDTDITVQSPGDRRRRSTSPPPTARCGSAASRTDTRVDARNAEVDPRDRAAAPSPSTARANEPIELTAPPRRLPARCGLHRRRPDHGCPRRWPAVKTEGNEQHASGPVNGGGPTITLRATAGRDRGPRR